MVHYEIACDVDDSMTQLTTPGLGIPDRLGEGEASSTSIYAMTLLILVTGRRYALSETLYVLYSYSAVKRH